MKKIQRTIPQLLLLSLLCFAAAIVSLSASADPQSIDGPSVTLKDDASVRFESLLKGIDAVPPSRDVLVRAWPDAQRRLHAAAAEPGRDAWTRARAISFLSYFPEAETRAQLVALSSDGDPGVRRAALYTLGRTFGVPGDAALVTALHHAATTDVDEEVRVHATRALRWIDHVSAGRALDALSTAEDDAVRLVAEHAMKRRQRRLQPQ